MRETIEILVMVVVYTLFMVWFGGWIEARMVNRVLPQMQRQVWRDGCNECVQFRKNAEDRDKLQGVRSEPEKIK